jgi:hypothetical protein
VIKVNNPSFQVLNPEFTLNNIQISNGLTISPDVTLSGHKMPLLEFGVFQNSNAEAPTLEAFEALNPRN